MDIKSTYIISILEVHIMSTKSMSIRIDAVTLDKLHVVADYEGRSCNSQILILIRDCIQKYEESYGIITHGKNLLPVGLVKPSDKNNK